MNNEVKKVTMGLVPDDLTFLYKNSFKFPKETQFLGAELMDKSILTIFYMAPEKNHKKTEEFEEYDFIVISLNVHSFTIPGEFKFLTTFPWGITTYGVFYRKS